MSTKITDKIVVSREKFNKLADIIERDNLEEISFEFLVGSCFPQALENIKKVLVQQHTASYVAGYSDGKRAAAEDEQLLNTTIKAD